MQKVWDKTSKTVDSNKKAKVGGNAIVLATVFAAYFRVFACAHKIGAVEWTSATEGRNSGICSTTGREQIPVAYRRRGGWRKAGAGGSTAEWHEH